MGILICKKKKKQVKTLKSLKNLTSLKGNSKNKNLDILQIQQSNTLSKVLNNIINPLVDEKKGSAENSYKFLNLIFQNKSSQIWKVKHKKIGLLRALTRIAKTNLDEEPILAKEFNILKNLDHPTILKIFEKFTNNKSIDIISEFSDGRKLYDEISEFGPFKEKIVANILYQLLGLLNYLHNTVGILHGRLNPNNITLNTYDDDTEFYDIKVIHFHHYQVKPFENLEKNIYMFNENENNNDSDKNDAKSNNENKIKIDEESINNNYNNNNNNIVYEKFFVAPETIKKNNYNEKADIYSAGCLAYYMVTGKIPYMNSRFPLKHILSNNLPDFNHPAFEKISREGKNLIKNMLSKNPKDRMPSQKLLKSKWFINLETLKNFKIKNSNYIKIINNIKKYKPTNKIQEISIAFLVHNIPDIEDVRDINKVYINFNVCNDGEMTKEQMKEGFDNHLIMNSNEKKKFEKIIDELFFKIDNDKNGYLEYEEFARAGIDKNLFVESEVLMFAFEFLNKDKSGKIYILPNEIKAILFGYDSENNQFGNGNVYDEVVEKEINEEVMKIKKDIENVIIEMEKNKMENENENENNNENDNNNNNNNNVENNNNNNNNNATLVKTFSNNNNNNINNNNNENNNNNNNNVNNRMSNFTNSAYNANSNYGENKEEFMFQNNYYNNSILTFEIYEIMMKKCFN